MQRGDYGYDAPYALIMFTLGAVFSGITSVVFLWRGVPHVSKIMAAYFLFFAASSSSFWYTTRRGKFMEWERILDSLNLDGNESILDIGCGRGAVLIAVAHRMKTGKVTGIDIWNTMDQSGNAKEVTLRNAELEGLADRIRIETGDMRKLPFADASFDVVVSSLAIHDISSNDDRKKAICEAYRVLKPGGRLTIADIRATRIYEEALRELGASNIERSRLGWRFWWGNPFAATTLLTASKKPS